MQLREEMQFFFITDSIEPLRNVMDVGVRFIVK